MTSTCLQPIPDRRSTGQRLASRPSITGYESPDEDHPAVLAPGLRIVPVAPVSVSGSQHSRSAAERFSSPTSLNSMVTKSKHIRARRKVGLRDRISCYQWTWFTMTMATGGVSNVLYSGSWALFSLDA